jgi:hypothetical protein
MILEVLASMMRMTLAAVLLMALSLAAPGSADASPPAVAPPGPAQGQTPPPAQTQAPRLVPVQPPTPPVEAPVPFPDAGKLAVFDMQAVVSRSTLGQAGSKKLNALRDQQNFQAKVLTVVEALRAKKQLWAVFSVSDAGLAAVHRGIDVTAEIITRLDASYPGGQ